jgi:GNAT superfamily N-acetyltransferase
MTHEHDPIPIEEAHVDEAAGILELQKVAYQSEAKIYDDFEIPPLTQTLAEMEGDFARQTILKASLSGRIVGSVRAYERDDTCHIGRVIVHPECQNRGLGARLLRAIEERFPAVGRYELFTGQRSERNLYFYKKYGYSAFRTEAGPTPGSCLVYLEKRAARESTSPSATARSPL